MVNRVTENHISKVKAYEERINLRRLMHLQMELDDKTKWMKGYEAEPNPYLKPASENVKTRMNWLEREIHVTQGKLSSETRRLIE
jgi:hypothetical protein